MTCSLIAGTIKGESYNGRVFIEEITADDPAVKLGDHRIEV